MSAEGGMAIAPTYPDFYIEEIASGVHTIAGVSASIARSWDSSSAGQ